MAPSRKRKRDSKDKSHTFMVSLDAAQSSSSVGPLAVIDKISSDYRRTLPQKHRIQLPSPPPQPFFDDFALAEDEFDKDTVRDLGIQRTGTDFAADAIVERRKVHASSVSELAFSNLLV